MQVVLKWLSHSQVLAILSRVYWLDVSLDVLDLFQDSFFPHIGACFRRDSVNLIPCEAIPNLVLSKSMHRTTSLSW
jgi:hypothetical protein